MPLTRAAAEAVLVVRCGAMLDRARVSLAPGYSAAADPAPRAYLGDPLAVALRALGYVAADPTNPADADLAPVPGTDYDALLDVAELRTLAICLRAYGKVDQQAGANKIAFGQILTAWQRQYDAKLAEVKALYGYGLQSLQPGALDLGFQATDDAQALAEIFT